MIRLVDSQECNVVGSVHAVSSFRLHRRPKSRCGYSLNSLMERRNVAWTLLAVVFSYIGAMSEEWTYLRLYSGMLFHCRGAYQCQRSKIGSGRPMITSHPAQAKAPPKFTQINQFLNANKAGFLLISIATYFSFPFYQPFLHYRSATMMH